jgi:HK97 family phage portal protein
MTSFTWRKMMIQSAIIKGNGISVILRNGSGVPLELRYIDYGDVVKVFKYNGNIFYQITGYGVLMSEDIFHIQGFSDNGLLGSSVIHYAAQSMGISLNAQDFASKSYDNKAISTGVLETEKEIKATNKLLVANAFSNAMNKTSNFRTAVLDEGMTYKRISLTPAELQFIETQANGVIEIARWLNIAPQKLKDMSNASYSALEFIDISHYKDCISPYMVKFSGEADRKLFSPAERKTYYTNFNINALMSADAATRANYYSKAIMMGWMTQNEVRALEEMNGKGEEHDVLLTPVNAQSIEQINAKLKQLESNG